MRRLLGLLTGATLLAGAAALAQGGPKPQGKAPAAKAGSRQSPAPGAAVPAPGIDLAYGAYQRGLYLTAFREATARLDRDSGDAAAMTLLGELFNQGLGVRQDPAEAARWYRLAASRGDAHAIASLGLMAADGRGVAQDPAEARRLFERAAALGDPTAAYNLALVLLASGSEPEIARAAGLLRLAAEAEIGDAQHDLGVLYARGAGVPRNAEEAARLYIRAAKNGSIAGEVELAIALANGDGVQKGEAEAGRLFLRAALRGNPIAQNRLARLYATGRGVAKNLVEAAAWHLMASGRGLDDSWLDAAVRDLSGQDRARAERLATDRAASL